MTEHLKLVLSSRLDEVRRAEDAVIAAAESMGFVGPDQFAIRLALEEALANAIKHGNQCDPEKNVTLECNAHPDRIIITVADEGPGFTPDTLPDPTAIENLEKPFGRGVMLMRAYMSEVTYNDSGNAVTMVRLKQEAET